MRFRVVFKGQEKQASPPGSQVSNSPNPFPVLMGPQLLQKKPSGLQSLLPGLHLGERPSSAHPAERQTSTVLRCCFEELAVIPTVVRQRILRRCVLPWPCLLCCVLVTARVESSGPAQTPQGSVPWEAAVPLWSSCHTRGTQGIFSL